MKSGANRLDQKDPLQRQIHQFITLENFDAVAGKLPNCLERALAAVSARSTVTTSAQYYEQRRIIAGCVLDIATALGCECVVSYRDTRGNDTKENNTAQVTNL